MNYKVVLLHIATNKEYLFLRHTYEDLKPDEKAEWQYLRDASPEKMVKATQTPIQNVAPRPKRCNCRK
jgi:hypothetical protein